MSDTTVINQKALDDIRSLQSRGSGDLLTKIITIYLEKSRSLAEEINQGASSKDNELLYMSAHSLKSSSASVGAMRIFDVCSDLEAKGKAGDFNHVNELVEKLNEELATATAELRSHLDNS
jgi:HPt (histidine-containing phosphotransfer) domain-containing protein